MGLRRRTKVAIVICVIVGLIPLFVLPLFPLPGDQAGGCIITSSGSTICSPTNESLQYAIFGQGYLSVSQGSNAGTYVWCTRIGGSGGSGYIC